MAARRVSTTCFAGAFFFFAGVFFFAAVAFFAGFLVADALAGVSVDMARRPGVPRARTVQAPVVLGGAEDPLHVVLRLGERDVVDELVLVEARPLRLPADDAAFAGVVAGQRVVGAAELRRPAARSTACRAGC